MSVAWAGSWLVAIAMAAVPLLLAGSTSAQRKAVVSEDIEVLVDGQVRRTWSGAELAAKQYAWRNLKGASRQVVDLTEAVPFDALGVPRDRLLALTIRGQGRLELRGEALEHLADLVLEIEADKGGAWKLIAKSAEADKTVAKLARVRRAVVGRVRQIELTTGPP
jgi:hypothetical protein